jgi:hypothetical protein
VKLVHIHSSLQFLRSRKIIYVFYLLYSSFFQSQKGHIRHTQPVTNGSSYQSFMFWHNSHILYRLVYDPFWKSSTIYYATKFGAKFTWVCCHISPCNFCHLKGWLILFVRGIESISLLWMQWQEERKQESFLKLVSATWNFHFVVRFCIWLFVYYGYTSMSIFHSTIQLVSWQSNKMWMSWHCSMSNNTVRSIHCWMNFETSHAAGWDITELVLETHLVTCLFCILFTSSHFMLYSSYIF